MSSRSQARDFHSFHLWLMAMPIIAGLVWVGAFWFGNRDTPAQPSQDSPSRNASQEIGKAPQESGDVEPVPAPELALDPTLPEVMDSLTEEVNYLDYLNQGTQFLNEGRLEEAIQQYEKALELESFDEDIHYNLGLAHTGLKNWDQAIRHYEQALELFPDYVEAHNNLGNLLTRREEYERAAEHLNLALDIDPEYAVAHNNLGNALGRQGKNALAFEHFKKAFELKPDYLEAQFNMANALMLLGQIQEAVTILQSILQKHPEFEPAREALGRVAVSSGQTYFGPGYPETAQPDSP